MRAGEGSKEGAKGRTKGRRWEGRQEGRTKKASRPEGRGRKEGGQRSLPLDPGTRRIQKKKQCTPIIHQGQKGKVQLVDVAIKITH
jgi:hypothetical protein